MQSSAGDHGVRVAGLASYLPGPALDRDAVRSFLRRYPDGLTEPMQERLLEETGIEARHYAIDCADERKRESNTSMATTAGRRAVEAAGWSCKDVDVLVVTTVVPDQLVPPTSALVQEALGIPRCVELEISANCSAPYKGLLFALDQLRSGEWQRALVCSIQYCSFLFRPPWANPDKMRARHGALRWVVSDGAGAVAIERGEPDTGLRIWLESSGSGSRPGMSLALGAAAPDLVGAFARGDHHVAQDDRYVLRRGMQLAVEGVGRMFQRFGIEPEKVDHFIPAVSSMQIARAFRARGAELYGLRPEAWRMNFTRVGYLGGVGLFAVLDELAREGRLRPGDLVCSFAEESSKWMCAGAMMRWNP